MSRREDGWSEEDIQKKAEGYECQNCGYTPTFAELDRGSCPRCPLPKAVPTPKSEP